MSSGSDYYEIHNTLAAFARQIDHVKYRVELLYEIYIV